MTLYKIVAVYYYRNKKSKLLSYNTLFSEVVIDNLEIAQGIFTNCVNFYEEILSYYGKVYTNANIDKLERKKLLQAPRIKMEKYSSLTIDVRLFEPVVLQDGHISDIPKPNVINLKWENVYLKE